jgi:hypothetical protein
MSFRGQASWAKMTSHGGKLIALACHPTKNVNNAEALTYLSTNIGYTIASFNYFYVCNNISITYSLSWFIK